MQRESAPLVHLRPDQRQEALTWLASSHRKTVTILDTLTELISEKIRTHGPKLTANELADLLTSCNNILQTCRILRGETVNPQP
jgi:hypothetical protein